MALDRFAALRDRLLKSGNRSLIPRPLQDDAQSDAMEQRLKPLVEAMFLVVASDGVIDESERAVLRGALRTLTAERLGTAALDRWLDELAAAVQAQGTEQRLDALASELYADREDGELALALAIAAGLASQQLAPEEGEVVRGLAERLGVSAKRMRELYPLD
jgi:uncharacterized membrane protein YebE (DUF533 family)